MPLTEKEIADYLQAPSTCPYCKSDDLEGQHVDVDDNGARQNVKCLACKRTWTDEYHLTNIIEEDEIECPSMSHLDRAGIVAILERYSIQCYDHEGEDKLKEALRSNVEDGTIPPEEVEL